MSRRNIRDDLDKFHDYGIYIPKRTIYMGSEEYDITEGESGTDGAMAEKIIKNLTILESMGQEPIKIIMNNVGGCEYSCFAVIDAIRACKSPVTIVALGHAMSAGSLILQAADERVMGPLAVQMIHYGTWGSNDHTKTFLKSAKECERVDEWMEQYYLDKIREKNPKFTLHKLRNMLDHDTYLTAKQSIDLGLADRIMGEEE